MRLSERRYWIFDLDGTLTVPAHDFAAIRRRLGLVAGRPILEQLAELPDAVAQPKRRLLQEIEHDIARQARPQPGAYDLLSELSGRGVQLGVLTRNSAHNALETLRTCGLDEFFHPADVLGRESCDPKPSPDGIRELLKRWDASPDQSVVVGDYLFDLLAGRGAGSAAVYLDHHGQGEWSEHADATVAGLHELMLMISA